MWPSLLPEIAWDAVAPTELRTGAAHTSDTRAMLEEIGVGAFAVEAKAARQPLTLVVNDPHRFTDTRSFIDAVFAILDALPVVGSQPGVRLLVAAGTHESDELERSAHEERMAAPYLARFAEIEWHDAGADERLARVGEYGFHRWMAGGGFYLACGSLEPHYFAGVTGAHKTLTVGVMSRASIERNHAGAMSPDVAPMRLAGSPVHEGIVAALGALEKNGARLLCVNQVIVGGRVVAVTGGHPLAALDQGVGLVRACFAHTVDEPLDVVVARVGAPLDRDLYQADKGIKNTEAAVKDGGVLVLDAACPRGVGLDHFVEMLRAAPTYAAAIELVGRRGYRLGDHKAVRLRALTDLRGVRVAIISAAIDPATSAVLGMQVFATREKAAAWLRQQLVGEPRQQLMGEPRQQLMGEPHQQLVGRPRAGESEKLRGLVVDDAGNMALELASSPSSSPEIG